jgi:hypothetical protein
VAVRRATQRHPDTLAKAAIEVRSQKKHSTAHLLINFRNSGYMSGTSRSSAPDWKKCRAEFSR